MVITNYDFYAGTYHGDIIPNDLFNKYEGLAEDEIHYMTRGRLKGQRSFSEEVKKCVCCLADIIYQIDQERNVSGTDSEGTGKIIKSRSSGNESISYEVQKSEFSEAAVSFKVRNRMYYEAARKYLNNTGLLYAGLE